ncbi:hypothetical protein [Enterococcus sp. AZ109]|uniref:hypothetical protein n=1 Tax=Enterococcus sp. AZ109 TaxID=2774634 RepID=UPI003F2318C2
MKKLAVLILFFSILLAGCRNNGRTSTNSSETAESKTTETSSSTSNSSSKASSSESAQTAESHRTEPSEILNNTVPSSEKPVNVPVYPYQTDLPGVTVFHYRGMNVPDSVTIDPGQSRISITHGDISSTYSMNIQNVPTKEIRVFSAANNQIRTVNVNTLVQAGQLISGDGSRAYDNDTFYLFHNSNGGFSLASPNYAGNVLPEDADVMLEVLQ